MSTLLDHVGHLSLCLCIATIQLLESANLCAPNEDCFLLCDESLSCQSTIIECPVDYQCSITCSSSYSCYQSTINATSSSLFILNGCDTNPYRVRALLLNAP